MSAKGTPAKAPAAAKKTDGKTPRERFLSVGASRVGKAIKAVRNVRNIASRKSYEYSEPEVRKALAAIRAEVDGLEKTFNDALAGGSKKETEAGFTFG